MYVFTGTKQSDLRKMTKAFYNFLLESHKKGEIVGKFNFEKPFEYKYIDDSDKVGLEESIFFHTMENKKYNVMFAHNRCAYVKEVN